MSHVENPLNNKTILSITISEDKETITFDCVEGKVIGECNAYCYSHTWIEHVEYPALGYPARVFNVEDLGLVGSEYDHLEHDYLQLYGYKISTEKGDMIIDFRNSSNGYYGGSLEWTFKPKEIDMSTTEQESIEHIRQTSETLDTQKEFAAGLEAVAAAAEIAGEDIRKIADATNSAANTQFPFFDSEGNATEYYKSLSRAEHLAIWHGKPHPKFIAAQVASNKRKAKQQDKTARLKQVCNLAGYRFLVFGRLTVCYRRSKHVMYVSTTLRNAKDVDNRLDAKLGAAYRMAQGEYIVVPIHLKNNAKHTLESMFFFATFV